MAKSATIQRPEKGTELFDMSEKVFPDVQAEPGETRLHVHAHRAL